ncbi:MAG: AAA family ATPase [Pseudomonadota bacterium]
MSAKRDRDHPLPGGYQLYTSAELDVLVPSPVAQALREERTRELVRLKAEEDWEWAEKKAQREREKVNKSGIKDAMNEMSAHLNKLSSSDTSRHLRAQDPMNEFDVMEPAALETLSRRIAGTTDGEQKALLQSIFNELEAKGLLRKISWPADPQRLQALESAAPHFGEVVRMAREEIAAAALAQRAPSLAPVLIVGSPGIGKTHFAKAFAVALGSPFFTLSFDTPLASSELAGMPPHWSTARPGLAFNALVLGECANPLIVLDELDKAGRSRQDDSTSPLHSLLEPVTATHFKDAFAGMPFDASRVTWLATANDASRIPDSIRSRFIEVHISQPTAAQAIEISQRVAATVIASRAPAGFQPMSRRLAVEVAHLTPREVQQAVKMAVATALVNGRDAMRFSDLPAWALEANESSAPVDTLH